MTQSDVEQNLTPPISDKPRHYVLKVISGPQIGAEIPLEKGSYVIGRHDDCDLIFNDQMVTSHHAKLILGATKIDMQALEGEIILEDDMISAQGREIQLYEVVGLGSTFFAIGLQDETWPELKTPNYLKFKEQEAIAAAAPPPVEEEKPKKIGPVEVDFDKWRETAEKYYTKLREKAGPRVAVWMDKIYQRISPTTLVWAVATALVLLVGTSVIMYITGQEQAAVERKRELMSDLARANVIISDQNLAQRVKATGPVKNKISFTGYVDTQMQSENLRNALDAATIPYAMDIYINLELAEQSRNILTISGVDSTVKILGDGILQFEGVGLTDESVKLAISKIHSDVKGILHIENKIYALDDIQHHLDELAEQVGLKGIIQFDLKKTRIKASGEINSFQKDAWATLEGMIKTAYVPAFIFISDVKEHVLTSYEKFQLELEGVSLLHPPYVVMKNEREYKVGDHPFEGLRIEEITKEAIILMDGKEKITYPYRQDINWVVESE